MPNESILFSFALWLSLKMTEMPGREKDDMTMPSKGTRAEGAYRYLYLFSWVNGNTDKASEKSNVKEGKGDREELIR